MATKKLREFTGTWHCVCWFPSNRFVGNESKEYDMEGYWDGDDLVLESIPTPDKWYMFVRLRVKDNIATGSWYSVTAPDSEFKGAQYDGSGQLIIDPKTLFMEGKWAGAGLDRKLKKMRIYTGNWEIAPVRGA